MTLMNILLQIAHQILSWKSFYSMMALIYLFDVFWNVGH